MEVQQLFIYLAISYWAYGIVNAGKVYVYSDWGKYFVNRVIVSMFLGWAMIPIAIIKIIIKK